eukprot:CAMPEP_0202499322 /NCGR_PEP_ID=MMETSP1361-20130828/29390_1 /ASSEMBLY_ACC=CAM_ASM_000849 /TAXON_ID=210615 /ORGANISM="Staurosira complex sp., Strain CCMP2646" /LENGTH=142 /DNA_ID=CAMNT_0049131483 /DNA_START=113 /DNA_END=541 /DNA_ORIENTATION=-
MNPFQPMLPAQQPIQRQDQDWIYPRTSERRMISNAIQIALHLRILFKYLEHHAPKMLMRVFRVYQQPSTPYDGFPNRPTIRIANKMTMKHVRPTVGVLCSRMYLEYYKLSCWPGSNPDHSPVDSDCSIALAASSLPESRNNA